MPALMPTNITGSVIWLGKVTDRDATLRSTPLPHIQATFAGVEGEEHAGLTRPSCSRVTSQYPRGTEIRNCRQFSIVSSEELQRIANAMGLNQLDPAWIGASLVVSGIPDFSHIPPSTRLQFDGGATLTVDMHNRPCHLPAKVIDEDKPGIGRAFKQAAVGLRGVTAWVEREGPIVLGQPISVHIPDQRPWNGLS